MKFSPEGIKVAHYYEQCILVAYPDPASPLGKRLQADGLWAKVLADGKIPAKYASLSGAPWTIGFGHTGPEVKPGLVWTREVADEAFAHRLATEFEPGVISAVRPGTSQCQFDAMVDMAYNVGVAAFRNSTLVKKHNAGAIDAAADEFLRWDKAGGQSMKGLRRRVASRKALYLGATGAEAIAIGQEVQ